MADSRYDIVYVVAAIVKLSVAGHELSVNQLVLFDCGDVGKSRKNALTVDITQTSFYVVFSVQSCVDYRVLRNFTCQYVDLRRDVGILPFVLCHAITSFPNYTNPLDYDYNIFQNKTQLFYPDYSFFGSLCSFLAVF